MSYQEKRTITSMLSGVLILAAYCIYAFGKFTLTADTPLKTWAVTMLAFIGIGIAATIIIQIVFHILLSISIAVQEAVKGNEPDGKQIEKSIGAEMVEDERDKLIEMKSMWVGFAVAGVGFVGGLLALVFDSTPDVMLNIMFISFSFGSVLEGGAQLYYYRKGVWHA